MHARGRVERLTGEFREAGARPAHGRAVWWEARAGEVGPADATTMLFRQLMDIHELSVREVPRRPGDRRSAATVSSPERDPSVLHPAAAYFDELCTRVPEFRQAFGTEAACRQWLHRARWPAGLP